jgi:hypothetical protein
MKVHFAETAILSLIEVFDLDSNGEVLETIRQQLATRLDDGVIDVELDDVPLVGEIRGRGNGWIQHAHFAPLPDEVRMMLWRDRYSKRQTLSSDSGLFFAYVRGATETIVLLFVHNEMHELLKDREFMRELERHAIDEEKKLM